MVASAPQVQIGELCDLIAEQRQPAETPNAIYVGLEHVESGRFQWKSCGRAADVQSHKFAFKRGDVLYSKLRPYLDKAVLADVDGLCTTELLVLRAKPGIDPRFLACVVHTPEFIGHAMTGVTGAQHPRTSWSHIESFEIPRFSSAKQAEISGLAWKIHELLISSENSIAAGEHLKRAAMKELFSRGVRGAGQTESDIGLVPNGWIVKTFSEVREWLQYGTSTHCTTEIKAFPVLRIPNVEPGRVNATDLKYCDLSDAEAQKYLLQPGDLLFIRTNGPRRLPTGNSI
jgi:type I restriction enzyme S subunit